MTRAARSAVMTEIVDGSARRHLLRADRQEDLCFALWHPSTGASRVTAVVERLVLPMEGERNVHGNASFESHYFARVLGEAAKAGAGVALLHSHPHGSAWQGMSPDDVNTEQSHAAAVYGATRLPFVGLTLAGDGAWSARFWERTAPRRYDRRDCATVRVVGERLKTTFMEALAPAPQGTEAQIRTISAWGQKKQVDLARLRLGIVGAGSVGAFIAEGMARTGVENVTVIDFDRIETRNLDRLLYATPRFVGALKAPTLAERLAECATAAAFKADPVIAAVYEDAGFRAALDCDVLFSCVDRPWGRHVLNLIAYAHLIPVIDGGISVRTNRLGELAAADWRAHTVTTGHRCMQCIGQYDPGLVQLEREGYLDDPTYINGLAKNHPLRARENVFTFSMACASQLALQMLALVIDPLGQSNPGEQLYHFVGSFMEPRQAHSCVPECIFPQIVGLADHCGYEVTGAPPPNRGQHVQLMPPARSGILQRLSNALGRIFPRWNV